MNAAPKLSPLYLRPAEIGRRFVGFIVQFAISAYGAAAALSVALSDAETVAGKSNDAIQAVPNLMERYRQAKSAFEHREQIRATLDYVHQNAPGPEQLETAARKSAETLERVSTTYREVAKARETFFDIRPSNILENLPQAKDHVLRAWAAKPDLTSIQGLTDEADDVVAWLKIVNDLDVDLAGLYAQLLSVLDNFASDEIAGTLGVMAAALGIVWVLSLGVGFWARRGRPGFIAALLHGWGARRFSSWYVSNLEHALGPRLYAVSRARLQRDIVADPRTALDPETLDELERYFARERAGEARR